MKNLKNKKFVITCVLSLVVLLTLSIYVITSQTRDTYAASTLEGEWKWKSTIKNSVFSLSSSNNLMSNDHTYLTTNHNPGYIKTYFDIKFKVKTGSKNWSFSTMSFLSYANPSPLNYQYRVVYRKNRTCDGGNELGCIAVGFDVMFDSDKKSAAYYNDNSSRTLTFYDLVDDNPYQATASTSNPESATMIIESGQTLDSKFVTWFKKMADPVNRCYKDSSGTYHWTNIPSKGTVQSSVKNQSSCISKNKVQLTFNDNTDASESNIYACYEWESSSSACYEYEWTGDETISFNINKGGSYDLSYEDNFRVDRDRYTLTGWNTKADGTGTKYSTTANITVNSDMTLYAQYEATKYTITYNKNGGSGSAYSVQEKYGATHRVRKLSETGFTAPSGKEFKEWNTSQNGSGTSYAPDATFTVTGNKTLYAIWKEPTIVPCSVSYDKNGGSGSMSASSTTSGGTVSLLGNSFTAPSSNKEFKEWNTKSDGSGTGYDPGESVSCTNDFKLYAIWNEYYTVTFNSNGGSAVNSQRVLKGSKATKPTDPTRNGYKFDKWLLNGSEYNFNNAVNSNITLNAQWKEQYDIIYEIGSGSGNIPNGTKTAGISYYITDAVPTAPSGYEFDGWEDINDTIYRAGYEYTTDSDLVLYARYTSANSKNVYSIIYNANGGIGAPAVTMYNNLGLFENTNISTAFPRRDGYTFTGWSNHSNCGTKIYTNRGAELRSEDKNKDIKLYACWTPTTNNNRCGLRDGDNPATSDKNILVLIVLAVSTMAWLYSYSMMKKAKQ